MQFQLINNIQGYPKVTRGIKIVKLEKTQIVAHYVFYINSQKNMVFLWQYNTNSTTFMV